MVNRRSLLDQTDHDGIVGDNVATLESDKASEKTIAAEADELKEPGVETFTDQRINGDILG